VVSIPYRSLNERTDQRCTRASGDSVFGGSA
jgi:hypothetical protein